MSGVDFLDSNVLIYLFDRDEAHKRAVAERLVESAAAKGSAVISHQVVQETLHVVTSKIRPALNAVEAQRVLVNVLVPLWRVMPSASMYARALQLRSRYRFGFYDSLIVAAAREAGCARLLSEDLQHGQRIDDALTIENPFLAAVG